MPTVFLSYRRSDSTDESAKLKKLLAERFGQDVVFRDVESIPAGADFRQSIACSLDDCIAMLAIIGSEWISVSPETGNRRLDDPHDFVRIELERALSKSIPVVPVLVRNANLPKAEELPESLKSLAFRNAVQIDADFNDGIDRLCDDITIQLWNRTKIEPIVTVRGEDNDGKTLRSIYGTKEIPIRCWHTSDRTKWEIGASCRDNIDTSSIFRFGCGTFILAFVYCIPITFLTQAFSEQTRMRTVAILVAATLLWHYMNLLLRRSILRIDSNGLTLIDGLPLVGKAKRFDLHRIGRVQVEPASLALVIFVDGISDNYFTVSFGLRLPPERRFFLLRTLRQKLRDVKSQSSNSMHESGEVGHLHDVPSLPLDDR